MKIKSTVWQVLAAGSFGAGLLYAETREQAARRNRYGRIDRRHARTEEPEYRQNRRDA